MDNIEALAAAWVAAKNEEKLAYLARVEAEEKLLSFIKLSSSYTGTDQYETSHFNIRVTRKLNTGIDAALLQDVAAKNGFYDFLSAFRWKPEIDAKKWAGLPENVKAIFNEAITTKPAKPSFSITLKD